jgi:cytochrome c peroxidase
LPPALAELRADAIERARGLEPEAEALLAAVEARDEGGSWRHYRELRRRDRELLPLTRGLAPVAASQLGATDLIEREEASPHAGFRPLAEALAARPIRWGDAARSAAQLRAAARLMAGELEVQDASLDTIGRALSDAAYSFGQRLDGPDALDQAERVADIRAEAGGLLRAAVALRDAARPRSEAAAQAIDDEAGRVFHFLGELKAEPAGLLDLLRVTGRLGAAIRRAARALGARPIAPPYVIRGLEVSGVQAGDAAVSAASFPRLARAKPDAAVAALGEALFSSTLLSRTRTVACVSCHQPALAFAKADPPALTFDRKVPPRNAPGLLNVAYEAMFFWDGRASTLDAQIDVAVDRDMGGDWKAIEARLAADPELGPRFERAFGQKPAAPLIKRAIVAYELGLVADDTPFDRYARGDDAAMDAELLRGFDLYFGKARCSRCHRLPLTSGLSPPRFLFTELSAIGVPTSPTARPARLDPDEGRAAITRRPHERGVFKVPALRNLARTAPYFHNGAFSTLPQVLDFYEKGGGPGLGYDVPNRDPDLAPLSLSASERQALLAFLVKGLADR